MLKKSFALGVLAAFAMAPAAFAGDAVQGNSTNTQINATNIGVNNTIGINNSNFTGQHQRKHGARFCGASGNKVQGNSTNTGINAFNNGYNNVTGIANSNVTHQGQVSGCGFRF
jgi:opacity protein-like surface antigen